MTAHTATHQAPKASELTGVRGSGLGLPGRAPIPEDGWPIVAREGWPIVAGFAIVTAAVWAAAWFFMGPWSSLIGAPLVLLTLWAVWFFRDPVRTIPAQPGAIVSPADGVVVTVARFAPPADALPAGVAAAPLTRISVFMNVFNVHVNRAPIAGTLEAVSHRPGSFLNASLEKASELNERCGLTLRTPSGHLVTFVQIAGLVARRIVCRARPGDHLSTGERFGLIRFGSRVDVYLPEGVEPRVRVGDVTVAGETVLAILPAGDRA